MIRLQSCWCLIAYSCDIQLGSTDHASTVSFSIQWWNNLPKDIIICNLIKPSLHLTTLKFQLCSLVIITFYCGNMPQLWLWSNFSCTILVYQNYKLLNYDWTTSSSTVWIIAVAIKMANSKTLQCISFTHSRCSSNNLLTCITSPQLPSVQAYAGRISGVNMYQMF